MSDIMRVMSFAQIMEWVMAEHKKGHVFGVRRPFTADDASASEIFGRKLETVIGPAAGPNTQLAQNIIASYYGGARFFELKTVQKLEGDFMREAVKKPCILPEDECFNCEWSTELFVAEAQHEYINAWVALHAIAKEYGLGDMNGFQFNLSLGYDLAGIKEPHVNAFFDNMIEAKDTDDFKTAIQYLKDHIDEFANLTLEDIESIPSKICNSGTISTLHGCPPNEIESIAMYFLTEKHVHTFIKCNPTLLGYDFARKTLDDMGYDYLVFGAFHFEDDLQYKDAVPMFRRLQKVADDEGLQFGLKLTNTFPVDVTRGELPAEEMYMSGRSNYALVTALMAKISKEFDGKMRIAMSGGADAYNIKELVDCGIWPVTMATTLLKTGGYQRFTQMAEDLRKMGVPEWKGVDVDKIVKIAEAARTDPHYVKAAKLPPNRKSDEKVPLMNCFTAPCQDRCPIHQDVSTYMNLASQGRYAEALNVILETNALPFITGKICAHPCQQACTRNFYEDQVHIRDTKFLCASEAYDLIQPRLKAPAAKGIKVGIIGGGPAGMAAAYYLAKGGASVTIFEKRDRLGGIVDYAIPDFRIDQTEIGKDAGLLKALGVECRFGCEVSVADVKAQGFDKVIVAIGATAPGRTNIENCEPLGALEFLTEFNAKKGKVDLGKSVVVIGGGNTAMDVARAAKRCEGVEKVSLVYRRTKRYMPADEEELLMAIDDGVDFSELLAPKALKDGQLICDVQAYGDYDASGRPSVHATGETASVPADTVILAIGERCDKAWYEANGINVDEKGRPFADDKMATSADGVYVIGDALAGPSIIVKAEANAKAAAEAILGEALPVSEGEPASCDKIIERKGVMKAFSDIKSEGERCLSCKAVCENCVDVCPNRANIEIIVPGMAMPQIVHVDYMCNMCGNCKTFCPYASAPYMDKWTLFKDEADMDDSENEGFVVKDAASKTYIVRFLGKKCEITSAAPGAVPQGLVDIMDAVVDSYSYLIFK